MESLRWQKMLAAFCLRKEYDKCINIKIIIINKLLFYYNILFINLLYKLRKSMSSVILVLGVI